MCQRLNRQTTCKPLSNKDWWNAREPGTMGGKGLGHLKEADALLSNNLGMTITDTLLHINTDDFNSYKSMSELEPFCGRQLTCSAFEHISIVCWQPWKSCQTRGQCNTHTAAGHSFSFSVIMFVQEVESGSIPCFLGSGSASYRLIKKTLQSSCINIYNPHSSELQVQSGQRELASR